MQELSITATTEGRASLGSVVWGPTLSSVRVHLNLIYNFSRNYFKYEYVYFCYLIALKDRK